LLTNFDLSCLRLAVVRPDPAQQGAPTCLERRFIDRGNIPALGERSSQETE
jgi:hypothetical protein